MSNDVHERVLGFLEQCDAALSSKIDIELPDWDTVIWELKRIASSHSYQVTHLAHRRIRTRRVTPDDPTQAEIKVINYYGHTARAEAFVLAHEVGHLLRGHMDERRHVEHFQGEREAWEEAAQLIKKLRGEIPAEFHLYKTGFHGGRGK